MNSLKSFVTNNSHDRQAMNASVNSKILLTVVPTILLFKKVHKISLNRIKRLILSRVPEIGC
jgi:hypothetical protein